MPPDSSHPQTTEQPADIVQANGMPSPAIMEHLLDLFDIHFACQFPALSVNDLRAEAMRGGGSIFLLNCIACSAARSVLQNPTMALADWTDSLAIPGSPYRTCSHTNTAMSSARSPWR